MEKWENKLNKYVNQNPSDEVTQRVNKTLQQLPKKRKRYVKIYYAVASVAIVFMIMLAASFISPVIADTMKSVPIIGSVFDKVGNIGIQRGNEQGLTTFLGEQVEMDGHLVTFTESLYDGSEIHIGYIIEPLQDNGNIILDQLFHGLELTINGKHAGSYAMGGGEKLFNNGNYVGTISIQFFQDEIPDSFSLGISSTKDKSWKVELPVTLQGTSQSFLINESRESKDIMIHFDKITFYPTATEVTFRQITSVYDPEEDPYKFMDYILIDDKGRHLEPFGGGGNGSQQDGNIVSSFKYSFEPLDQIPNSLTFKPFLWDMNNDNPIIVREKWEGTELTLSQGEIGTITILNVEDVGDFIKVIYLVEGENLYDQAASLMVEDSSGNRYVSETSPKLMDNTINQYETTFSVPTSMDELMFVTYEQDTPNFLSELEITIDLKE